MSMINTLSLKDMEQNYPTFGSLCSGVNLPGTHDAFPGWWVQPGQRRVAPCFPVMLNAGAAAVLAAELAGEAKRLCKAISALLAGTSLLSSLPTQGMCWSLNSCACFSQWGNLSLEMLHLFLGLNILEQVKVCVPLSDFRTSLCYFWKP